MERKVAQQEVGARETRHRGRRLPDLKRRGLSAGVETGDSARIYNVAQFRCACRNARIELQQRSREVVWIRRSQVKRRSNGRRARWWRVVEEIPSRIAHLNAELRPRDPEWLSIGNRPQNAERRHREIRSAERRGLAGPSGQEGPPPQGDPHAT